MPSQKGLDALYVDIENYYSERVRTYGATPLGVDWTCVPTQQLRFVQLLKLCSFRRTAFSLNDLGCGYGALKHFLSDRYPRSRIDYLGVDISPLMIEEARRLWKAHDNTKFVIADTSPRVADYSVASGIFNVRLYQPLDLWMQFIEQTLTNLHATSRLGFAVNFLTQLPSGITARPELYRSLPETWALYCTQKFNSRVKILENYGLREFSLLVKPRL
nr:class I SAM-dependent methyltransferase [Variovorax terrae]